MTSSNHYLFHYFLLEYHFGYMLFWYVPTFSGRKLGHKSRSSYKLGYCCLWWFLVIHSSLCTATCRSGKKVLMFQKKLLPLHAIGCKISNGFSCFGDHRNSPWVTVIFNQCDQPHISVWTSWHDFFFIWHWRRKHHVLCNTANFFHFNRLLCPEDCTVNVRGL